MLDRAFKDPKFAWGEYDRVYSPLTEEQTQSYVVSYALGRTIGTPRISPFSGSVVVAKGEVNFN